MPNWAPITGRDFWDVPRIFLVRHGDDLVLFDCAFDEQLDDFPDDYAVFVLPPDFREDDLPKDWTTLRDHAVRRLGSVPVTRAMFDPTLRKQVDLSVLDALTARPTA